MSDTFINFALIIAEQIFLHIPLIAGSYLSLSLLKVPDLSLESAYVFGAILGAQAVMLLQKLPTPLLLLTAVLAGLLGGLLVGLTSSIMTQKAHIPHLLSSILTFGIFHGVNQLVLGSYASLSGLINPLSLFAFGGRYPELPSFILIFCIVIGLMFWFLRTQLGYAFAAYGNNPQFFEHYGISTSFVFIMAIVIANSLAGLSGYLFAQSNGFVEVNMGLGKILLCITSLILGKALVFRNRLPNVILPVMGTVCYFILQQMLLKAGFDLKYFTALQSMVILLMLIIAYKRLPKRRHMRHIDHLGV